MAEAQTLYKLIVLTMLSKVDFPLTNAQISDFILTKEYTNYFTLQQVLSELVETELADKATGVNYICTQSGYAGGMTPLLKPDGTPVVTQIPNYYE